MKTVFSVIAIGSLFASVAMAIGSQSAIHEIEAGGAFICFVVALGFAAVIPRSRGAECPSCLEDVHAGAVACPHCGREIVRNPVENQNFRQLMTIAGAALLLIVLAFLIWRSR